MENGYKNEKIKKHLLEKQPRIEKEENKDKLRSWNCNNPISKRCFRNFQKDNIKTWGQNCISARHKSKRAKI